MRILLAILLFTLSARAQTPEKIAMGAAYGFAGFSTFMAFTDNSGFGPTPWSPVCYASWTGANLLAFGILHEPSESFKDNWLPKAKQFIPPMATGFLHGFLEGYKDVLLFHPSAFFAAHPKANPQWWNPNLSWTNKTGAITFGTDFYHTASQLQTWVLAGGIGVTLVLNKETTLKQAVLITGLTVLTHWTTKTIIWNMY